MFVQIARNMEIFFNRKKPLMKCEVSAKPLPKFGSYADKSAWIHGYWSDCAKCSRAVVGSAKKRALGIGSCEQISLAYVNAYINTCRMILIRATQDFTPRIRKVSFLYAHNRNLGFGLKVLIHGYHAELGILIRIWFKVRVNPHIWNMLW